jgi:4-amino-4-deoxy-L-arabinose transferase-like glycosyltransferase
MVAGATAELKTALAVWALGALAMVIVLPALPVDETRYLTVAWEMRHSGHWLLPTLNGEPYSHKPPLLFWLINAAWSVLGVHVWPARLVTAATAAGVLAMTFRLARELFRERAPLALALLLAMPAFALYSTLIMFDLLLTVAVLIGLVGLWRMAHAPSRASTLLYAAGIGLGLVTKGPVILLHLLPPALLVRLWHPAPETFVLKSWLLRVLACVGLGTLAVLAWAIPAAISGGEEFAEMIFWKQSSGRLVNSFAHREPFWFFVPVLALFLLPLFFWRPAWRGAARLATRPMDRGCVFLLAWIVPAFILFSMISGKQPHYMLPLLPGIAILLAALIRSEEAQPRDLWLAATPFAILFGLMLTSPLVALAVGHETSNGYIADGLGQFSPLLTLAGAGLAAGLLYAFRRTLLGQVVAIAGSVCVLVGTLALQCSRGIFQFYDLSPIAHAIAAQKGPVVSASHYAGELGFLGQLERPIEVIKFDELQGWFAQHPDGVAMTRFSVPDVIASYDVIYRQAYRSGGEFVLLKVKGANKARP